MIRKIEYSWVTGTTRDGFNSGEYVSGDVAADYCDSTRYSGINRECRGDDETPTQFFARHFPGEQGAAVAAYINAAYRLGIDPLPQLRSMYPGKWVFLG